MTKTNFQCGIMEAQGGFFTWYMNKGLSQVVGPSNFFPLAVRGLGIEIDHIKSDYGPETEVVFQRKDFLPTLPPLCP